MGVLPDIADGVGVDIPTAGHVISLYALGVVIGAPVIAALGARLPRRTLLVGLMGAFLVGNGLSALAPGYRTLLVARFLSGLPHGAYFGVASLVAASLVAPHLRGRAVSSVMLGLATALVAGVPTATWLGQTLGWRSAYWTVVALAGLTATAVLAVVPSAPGNPEATVRGELSALRRPQVLLTLGVGIVGFGRHVRALQLHRPGGHRRHRPLPRHRSVGAARLRRRRPARDGARRPAGRPRAVPLARGHPGHDRRAARRHGPHVPVGARPLRRCLPRVRGRLRAGHLPAAAAHGDRRRRADARGGAQPLRPQSRQRPRRGAGRTGDRRRLRAPGAQCRRSRAGGCRARPARGLRRPATPVRRAAHGLRPRAGGAGTADRDVLTRGSQPRCNVAAAGCTPSGRRRPADSDHPAALVPQMRAAAAALPHPGVASVTGTWHTALGPGH